MADAALGGVFAIKGFVEQLQLRPVPQRLLATNPSKNTLALEHILVTGLDVVRETLRSKHHPHIWATRPGFARLGLWNLEFPNAFLFEIGLQFAHLPRTQWPRVQQDGVCLALQHLRNDFDKPIETIANWELMDARYPNGSRRMFAQWPLPEDMRRDED